MRTEVQPRVQVQTEVHLHVQTRTEALLLRGVLETLKPIEAAQPRAEPLVWTKIEPIEQVEAQELFLDITAHQEAVKRLEVQLSVMAPIIGARRPRDIVEHAVAPHLEHLLIKVQEAELAPARIEADQEVRQVEVVETIAPREAPAEVQVTFEVQEALPVLHLVEGHQVEAEGHQVEVEDHQVEVAVDNRSQKFH